MSQQDRIIDEQAEGDESDKNEEPKKRKKLEGQELIAENLKELSEVIAFMDYSFERAFTMQEKECMLAYKVSLIEYNNNFVDSNTWPQSKTTSTT